MACIQGEFLGLENKEAPPDPMVQKWGILVLRSIVEFSTSFRSKTLQVATLTALNKQNSKQWFSMGRVISS